MAKNKDYVSVPRDEYEELVECKTKVNLLIDYVIGTEKTDIFQSGTATTFYDADAVNNILGSTIALTVSRENIRKRKWVEKNENDFKIVTY